LSFFEISSEFPEHLHDRHVLATKETITSFDKIGKLNPKFVCPVRMTKETEYRANAANSIELANRASSMSDKSRLLELAEKWLDLAERARLTHHFAPSRWQHPLLRSKLGDEKHPDLE
jgi:hypothetical protein